MNSHPFSTAASRRPSTGVRLLLLLAAGAGGAVLFRVAFPPGARDRLPLLVFAVSLALVAAWRPRRAILAFSFLFPCSGLLARLFGGTEPLAWPVLLFAGLAAGWTFRFIYDFESRPDPSRWDPWLRALGAVWVLAAAVALARAHTLWALAKGISGRVVNGAGLPESAAVRESLLALAVLLCGAGFFFLLRRSGGAVRASALTAALSGIGVSAVAALLQRAGVLAPEASAFWRMTGRLSGAAMDPNSLGLLCALAATVLTVWMLLEPARRLPLAGFLLLALAGLALSGSRSGLLVPLIGLPAVLWLRRRTLSASRRGTAVGLAALAALLAVLLMPAGRSGSLARRLAQTFDPSLPLQFRVSERPVLWRSAGRLFLRSPLEGAGLGVFTWMLPDLLAEEGTRLPLRDNPGSAYVQSLAETGAVGFLLTLVLAVSLGRQAIETIRDPAEEPRVVGAAAAAAGFLVAQLLGSHWLAPDAGLFFFLLAAVVARPRVAPVSVPSRWLLRAAVAVYAVAAAVAAFRTADAGVTFRHDGLAGFYPAEQAAGGSFRWTRQVFGVWLRPGESRPLRLAYFPPDQSPVTIEAEDGESVTWRRTLRPGEAITLRLSAGPATPRPVIFRLSRTFVPKRLGISGDRRELGLMAAISE